MTPYLPYMMTDMDIGEEHFNEEPTGNAAAEQTSFSSDLSSISDGTSDTISSLSDSGVLVPASLLTKRATQESRTKIERDNKSNLSLLFIDRFSNCLLF
jgi:hypothetical protein